MTDEEVIRSEAKEAVEMWDIEYTFSTVDVIPSLQSELLRFYAPTNKAIFLNEVLNQLTIALEEHEKECTTEGGCMLDKNIRKVLFFTRQEISQLPPIIHESIVHNNARQTVFISYSHLDKDWLTIIKRHFKPLENRIDFWDDSKIIPGQKWEDEIKNAISRAKVALLLVSADFFNSEFITKKEIPPLLKLAENDGATILFLVLKPCMIDEYPQIKQYQGLNAPSMPFIRMGEADREELCVSVASQIRDILLTK